MYQWRGCYVGFLWYSLVDSQFSALCWVPHVLCLVACQLLVPDPLPYVPKGKQRASESWFWKNAPLTWRVRITTPTRYKPVVTQLGIGGSYKGGSKFYDSFSPTRERRSGRSMNRRLARKLVEM
jgi:hypothetical protein